MSIRLTVLALLVIFLSGYAFKNWFNALIGGIVLFAFLENPDIPRSIGGIPGLNFWNFLFFCITVAWLSQRQEEGNELDFPGGIRIALIFYLCVVFVSFLRAFIEPSLFYEGTRTDLFLNYLVNPLKFLLPALMLYDGCRSRGRVFLALSAILSVYFLLAVLSIKSMGFHFDMSSGDDLSDRAARRLGKDVGYHRVDLSMMLSGASWAIIAFSGYFRRWSVKLALFGASAIVLVGQAVTGGRMGYVTWALIGLTLCVIRWRKLLPVIPVAIAVLIAFVPAVRERMFQGFAQDKGAFTEETDASSITSGRSVIWPLVISEIQESPVVGYGRIAMQRAGVSERCREEYGQVFGHPHNAYLEFLLDNGVLGFLIGMPIFAMLLRRNFQLFRDRDDVLFQVAGGVGLCLLMALFIAAMGAQTFYPREGVVPMWAALAVALRVWVQRENALEGQPLFPDDAAGDDEEENLEAERFSYDR